MSGSTRAITLKLSVQDADTVLNTLRSLGPAGEEALRRLEAGAKKGGDGARNAAAGFSTLGQTIQSAGYQAQDFFVQIQAGTNILTALSQQGSQFLGNFGMGGAIAGAVLAVGVFAAKLLDTSQSIEEIKKGNEEWKRSQDALNAALETSIQKMERLTRARFDDAAAPQRTALGAAAADQTRIGSEILRLEAERKEWESRPRQNDTSQRMIAEIDQRLRGLRWDMSAADRRAAEARTNLDAVEAARAAQYGPQQSTGDMGTPDPGRAALQDAARARAEADRLRGLNPQRAAVEQARISAEKEADAAGLWAGGDRQKERNELIANRVAAAEAKAAYAAGQAAEAEDRRAAAAQRRMQNALQAGETEKLRSQEQLTLQEKLAAAESPRDALLARQKAEIDRVTASIRARKEEETDPAIRAELEKQIKQITALRTESVALEQSIRNRNVLWDQSQDFARQAAERQAMGMSRGDAARFLGEFGERQRMEDKGEIRPGETATGDLLLRIKNAGDLAFGDEQMRRMKEFQGGLMDVGRAFGDAFSDAIFNGKKLDDVLADLDKSLAQIIFRMMVMKPLENALGGLGNSLFNGLGSSIGNWWGGGSTSSAQVPVVTPTTGVYANGGIMTEFGPLPLQKYAGGGVARTPQVAVFGEGRRPEAYVPLPDGRSIPVTMAGGGGGGTVVNIDARGAEQGVEARINAVLAQRLPGIVAITKSSLAGDVNRGGQAARTFGRRA